MDFLVALLLCKKKVSVESMNPITDLVQAAAKLLSKPIGGFKSQNKF